MRKTIGKVTAAVSSWLIRRPAYMILTAGDDRLAIEPARRFVRLWASLVGLSLLWGIASAGVWAATWRVFGDYNVIIMPPVVTAAALVLWLFRRSVLTLARALGGDDPTGRSVAAAILVVAITMCLMRLRSNTHPAEHFLPHWLAWVRPADVLYRVLLMMPLWGAWAMMITCQFCKPNEQTAPSIIAFAGGFGATTAAAVMAALMGLTILYFTFLPWWSLLAMCVSAVLAGAIGGLCACRRSGGLKRDALLAANLITQIAFLLACLACSQ